MHAEPDRATVAEAIKQAFPNNHEVILREMQWDSICGNWVYTLHRIFFGIEVDGYIHS